MAEAISAAAEISPMDDDELADELTRLAVRVIGGDDDEINRLHDRCNGSVEAFFRKRPFGPW